MSFGELILTWKPLTSDLSTRQSKPAWPIKPRRDHEAWEKAHRGRIYSVAVTVAAAMIALVTRAFMQPPIRF
jgi:hypothetical protein